ncbi:hypothetical protein HD554DRAFT_2205892 [Boletus coccyginus]|nr:hypothetical protein HD554DRAFT_2205892 [Boletus coccyginus]
MSPAGHFPVYPYHLKSYICSFPNCHKSCRTKGDLKCHAQLHRQQGHQCAQLLQQHADLTNSEGSSPGDLGEPNPDEPVINTDPYYQHTWVHPLLNGNHWTPYASHAHFELAEFLYQKVQMSIGKIDMLMDIWFMIYDGHDLPFRSHNTLYKSIDTIPYRDCPWQSFSFADEIDYGAKVNENGQRKVCNLMSDQWAWDQLELITQDLDTCSTTFAPIVLGSNKTTVSVGTGNTEYYLLYISLGNIHNNVCHSYSGAVTILTLLTISKTDSAHKNNADFHHFCRQLFHSSLAAILNPVKQAMVKLQVILACIIQGCCTAQNSDLDQDGGLCAHRLMVQLQVTINPQVLWDDYGIVGDVEPFTAHFSCPDIHELIVPDLLYQLIKGTFKDHLVSWVNNYLEHTYPKQQAMEIIAKIDCRWIIQVIVAAVPPFPGLRQFPKGRGFKQWTGDNSKALMKVYLSAITGLVLDQMVCTIMSFLNFFINETDFDAIDDAVQHFYLEWEIFKEVGVRDHFSLPHQHVMVHYRMLIEMFVVPNGLCSSIMESCHIKAVKELWCHSNRFEALEQMLGMLDGLSDLQGRVHDISTVPPLDGDKEDEPQAVKGDKSIYDVQLARKPVPNIPSACYGIPELAKYIQHFLYDQQNPDAKVPGDWVDLQDCPSLNGDVKMFTSTSATYHASSDHSGQGRMHRDIYNCILVNGGSSEGEPLSGLQDGHSYSCALVEWFLPISDKPDELMVMWIVVPEAVISINTIL